MEKLTITYLEEDGTENSVDYMVESEVMDLIDSLDEEVENLTKLVIKLTIELAASNNVIDGYRILCNHKEIDN